MNTISSNYWSTDIQVCDAMIWLRLNHPEEHATIERKFPILSLPYGECWFADAYPEIDPEYGSWLIDAIEATGLVWWEDGEPWAGERNEDEDEA